MSPRAAWRLESLGFKTVHDYAAGEADWAAAGLPLEGSASSVRTIGDLVRKDAPIAVLGESLAKVKTKASDWSSAMVVNSEGVLLGRLDRDDLMKDEDTSVETAMSPGPSTFRPNLGASEMLELMRERELDLAPVTTPEGVLIGVVTIEDLESAAAQSE